MRLRARRLSCSLIQECGRAGQRLSGLCLSQPALRQRRRQVTFLSLPGYMSTLAPRPGSSTRFPSPRPGRRPLGQVDQAAAGVPTRHCSASASARPRAVPAAEVARHRRRHRRPHRVPTPDERMHGQGAEAPRAASARAHVPRDGVLRVLRPPHRRQRLRGQPKREPAAGCRWSQAAVWFSFSEAAAGSGCADATSGRRVSHGNG
jgi:hypothetical protein